MANTNTPAAQTWLDIVGPISITTFMEEHPTPGAAVDAYITGRYYLRDDDRSDDDFLAPYPRWMVDGEIDPPPSIRAELLSYIQEHRT